MHINVGDTAWMLTSTAGDSITRTASRTASVEPSAERF
jgi:hypothetical protein